MRIWSNRDEDDISVFCIGNGKMIVYERGPNIINLYGPPYSAPSFLTMFFSDDNRHIQVEPERQPNTAIWHHNVYIDGTKAADMTDYMIPDKNVFFRDIEASVEFSFVIKPEPDVVCYSLGKYFQNIHSDAKCVLLKIPKGTTFFWMNPIPWETDMIIAIEGNGSICISEKQVHVLIKPGKSRLIFSGGTSLPNAVEDAEYVLSDPDRPWIKESEEFWSKFSARRLPFELMIPQSHPLRDKMLEAIDSVSVLVKCQQSESGGVMAGHIYNMAYVRDMSGVMRGLLALGYIPEAKAILDFWMHKFNLYGDLLNAEGMDNDAARLPFTNDEVEIPAYIIMDCFYYYEKTQDEDFIIKAFPMMEWAFEVQLPHLVEGMTEFSGDETYMAGGTLPYSSIYHGSAESTLLFITGGEKLWKLAKARKLWNSYKLEKYYNEIMNAKANYKKNFVDEASGLLYVNNPARVKAAGIPRFRFSYCALHYGEPRSTSMAWLEVSPEGLYLCPACRDKRDPSRTAVSDKRYILNSVNLVPVYINSDLFTRDEIDKIIAPAIEGFESKGIVPSNTEGNRSLGYDYGLMLYNLVKLNHPLKDKLLGKILNLLDPTGAWVEYYDNDKPYNCRCRAWESAINIEAVVEYIKSL